MPQATRARLRTPTLFRFHRDLISRCGQGEREIGGRYGRGSVFRNALAWNKPTGSSDPVVGHNVYWAISRTPPYQLVNSSVVVTTAYTDATI